MIDNECSPSGRKNESRIGFGEGAERETMQSILEGVEEVGRMDDGFNDKETYKDGKEYINTLSEDEQANYVEETFNLTLTEVK